MSVLRSLHKPTADEAGGFLLDALSIVCIAALFWALRWAFESALDSFSLF